MATKREQMLRAARKTKQGWVKWLKSYGAGNFFDAFVKFSHDAESECVNCGEKIYLDIVDGGGGPDWGAAFPGPTRGLDYGCDRSPHTNSEGTGGHVPKKLK